MFTLIMLADDGHSSVMGLRGIKCHVRPIKSQEHPMPALLSNIDPDGLLEFSVVYTDRALNHMSQRFQGVMRDISGMLKQVYNAHKIGRAHV